MLSAAKAIYSRTNPESISVTSGKQLKIKSWGVLILFICFQTGHYVPQLAELMLQFNKNDKLFNLKGIVVRQKKNW